jgi:allantoate deiminase
VDARHVDGGALADFCASLEAAFAAIAEERGLGLSIEKRLAVEPVAMDAALRERIVAACEGRGLPYRVLPSGAGHDSQVLAGVCPAAMIFVPSRKGVSHSPQEFSTHRALVDGMEVLRDVLYDLAWKGTQP